MAKQPARRPAKSQRSSRKTGRAVPALTRKRSVRWDLIAAGVVVLALIGALGYRYVPQAIDQARIQQFVPSDDKPDPADQIEGVIKAEYAAGKHVRATERVAYDKSPAFGGPHDQYWATCTGIIYPQAIRTENAVHSLEHGAVWIAYDPGRLGQSDVSALKKKVEGKSYMLMSPYPGMESAVSLMSWGHRLGVDQVSDSRIDKFVTALRQNPNTHPEFGASCATAGGGFDPDAPPAFDPTPPGPDAVPLGEAPTTTPPARPEVNGGN